MREDHWGGKRGHPWQNLSHGKFRKTGHHNKSERKVAEVILKDPEAATDPALPPWLKAAKSQPTVNRLCNRFDTSGYPDFKIQLALSLVKGTPYVSENVDPDDNLETFTDRILPVLSMPSTMPERVEPLPNSTEPSTTSCQAKQIACFRIWWVRSRSALDAQYKFFRFNIRSLPTTIFLMQRMVAAGALRAM